MNLALASFDDIAEELAKRFENMVIIGHNSITHEPGFNSQQRYRFSGDPNTVLGLLDTVHYNVLMEKERLTEDTTDV